MVLTEKLREELYSSLILLVDDMEFNLILLEEILKSRGFTNIEIAHDGKDALEKTRLLHPNLIILDLLMPKLDGFEFCKAIRADPILHDIPILVQTALTIPEQRTKAFEAGATDFVTKPLDAEEIISRSLVRLEHKKLVEDLKNSQKRMKDELESARDMQLMIVPSQEQLAELKQSHKLDIHSFFKTSSELGGDFWGVRPLSDTKIALYTVDFSGHGVTAALNTFRLHTLFSDSSATENPGEYITQLNRKLTPLLATEQFATMFFGVLDMKKGILDYVTAGTTDAFILPAVGNTIKTLEGAGLPLGISAEEPYRSQQIPLQKGDILLLYSDALIETEDEYGDYLEARGVLDFLESYLNNTKAVSGSLIFNDLIEMFSRRYMANLRDDCTVTVFSYN
jgi:sigma-B regulation protein RsbU (phosphoserine phosphatase)